MSGFRRLRKVATMMMYTSRMATSMAMPSVRNTSLVTSVAPASSHVAPAGSVTLSSAAWTAEEAAPMLLFTDCAVMLAVRSPFTCVTCTGAFTSAIVAMELIGTMPVALGTGRRSRSPLTAPGIGGSVIFRTVSSAGRAPASVGTTPSG